MVENTSGTTKNKSSSVRAGRVIRTKKTVTPQELEEKKERVRALKRTVDKPKLIGEQEELIPFSWRYPLSPPEDGKMNKVYKEVVALEKALSFHNGNKR